MNLTATEKRKLEMGPAPPEEKNPLKCWRTIRFREKKTAINPDISTSYDGCIVSGEFNRDLKNAGFDWLANIFKLRNSLELEQDYFTPMDNLRVRTAPGETEEELFKTNSKAISDRLYFINNAPTDSEFMKAYWEKYRELFPYEIEIIPTAEEKKSFLKILSKLLYSDFYLPGRIDFVGEEEKEDYYGFIEVAKGRGEIGAIHFVEVEEEGHGTEYIPAKREMPIFAVWKKLIMKKTNAIVLKSATGTGKSTYFITFLIRAMQWLRCDKKVIITQPRQLTTREISDFVDKLYGPYFVFPPDHVREVGYQYSLQKVPGKYAMFMTEGLLLQKIINDPSFLLETSLIVLDEVHERSADLDLLMNRLKYYLDHPIRDKKGNEAMANYKIILMSATFDVNFFSKYFNTPAKFDITTLGAVRKQVNYLRQPSTNWIDEGINVIDNIAAGMLQPPNFESKDAPISRLELTNKNKILWFVPTQKRINQIIHRMKSSNKYNSLNYVVLTRRENIAQGKALTRHINTFPTSFPLMSNDDSLSKDDGLFLLILATDIAETGITIENLGYVIDSGYTNTVIYNPFIDTATIMLNTVSKNNAVQRWGRVGRSTPGIVYCLYPYKEYLAMDENKVPQVFSEEFSGKLLKMMKNYSETNKISGRHGFDYIRFGMIEQPIPESIMRALSKITSLGLLDRVGNLNQIGILTASLSMKPEIVNILLLSCAHGIGFYGVVFAAIMMQENSLFDLWRPDNSDRSNMKNMCSFINKSFEKYKSEPVTMVDLFMSWLLNDDLYFNMNTNNLIKIFQSTIEIIKDLNKLGIKVLQIKSGHIALYSLRQIISAVMSRICVVRRIKNYSPHFAFVEKTPNLVGQLIDGFGNLPQGCGLNRNIGIFPFGERMACFSITIEPASYMPQITEPLPVIKFNVLHNI